MPPKSKSTVPIMYQTQMKEIKRYSVSVDDAIVSKNMQKIINLKANIFKCRENLEAYYYEYSILEEFNEEVEYKIFTDSKDIADLALEKIESYLSEINDKLRFEENDKAKESSSPYININLPKFDLPTFSGNFDAWLSFKSIFISSIDSNESLTDIQKLQYLQNSVTSDASRLIRGFAITKENYKHAWETLLNRYDNQRELAFSQCKKIFNLKTVKLTSESIRVMIDICNEVLRNFKTLGLESNQLVELLLVFTLQDKLEDSIKVKWELTLEDKNLPSLDNFLAFLEKQARSLQGVKITNSNEKSSKMSHKPYALKTTVNSSKDSCKLCFSHHLLHKCEKFLKMSVDDRWKFVKESKLCFNCLRNNHSVISCKFTTYCRVCKQKHHTVLHAFRANQRDTQTSDSHQNQVSDQNSLQPLATPQEQSLCLTGHMNNSNLVLLSTAIVKVKDCRGQFVNCRALIDNGSQTSLITESCCKSLNLPFIRSENTILGIDNKVAALASKRVKLEISPHFSQDTFSVNALVVKKITSDLPNFFISEFDWPHLKGLQLADPSFHISRPVDIILGADIFFDLIQYGKISGNQNQPSALNSRIGWLLSGRVSTAHQNNTGVRPLVNCHALLDLENLITKFWEVESIPEVSNFSDEDQECERFYLEHTKRDCNGRFVVRLPFRKENALGDSKIQAKRRFFSLEKRLQNNIELKNQYVQFMREYQQLDHMKPIPNQDLLKPSSQCFYLPHFGVIREQSETTKLRVVFDASAKSETGVSLNDVLHTGPKLQNELFNILIKFRTHSIVLTGDIEKMFRQVRVNQDDVDFQRIFWRENPEEPLQEFQLLTITYGASCAPYLAIRTLQELAKQEEINFPDASKVVLEDTYVDDVLTGRNSILEAKRLLFQIIKLMKKGCFPIRKWASNEPSVIESLPPELRSSSASLQIEEDHTHKILGISWNAREDVFKIEINPSVEGTLTKRQLLSTIAKIYDPLGFLSPTTIQLKILMQSLWKRNVGWDDPLPDDISKEWNQFRSQIEVLAEIKIPRFLMKNYPVKSIELHGFCDSSQHAYAAVLFLRTEFDSGEVHVSMITSKTRVAPLKTITLPRLELCAALLLSQLFQVVIGSLRKTILIDRSVLYSDSKIVLDWLNSSPQRWKTFVCNRISKIQDLTAEATWKYVRSQENPADCASRGISASNLKCHKMWWRGPAWLGLDGISNPQEDLQQVCEEDVSCEQKKSSLSVNVITSSKSQANYVLEILYKYSSFSKLIRIMSWCLRFIHNCRQKIQTDRDHGIAIGFLKTSELNDAIVRIVKLVQQSQFKSEIQSLRVKGSLEAKSNLISLNPFLDENDILRVGGRLKHSNLTNDQKHPMLLPKEDHFSDLIIDYYHKLSLHGGTQIVLSLIRQRFWLISGRDKVRRNIQKCLTCFKTKNRTFNQIMGNLPKDRITPSRPFQKTGLDFAGPIITKPNLKRTKVTTKSYIAIFICFATKAVHLEVVSDLSTESFLACLRRFISRRGKPSDIYSDNATNFKGARNYLQNQTKILKSESIQNFTSDQFINWHFIPPGAPHFGGLWESNIKSMKQHLYKTCKSAVLNYEELSTLIIQIEACMNSRPLTPLSNDPNDLEALTPAHFLIGSSLLTFPDATPAENSLSYISRFKLIQVLRAQFWKRWSSEYLTQLQRREKWTKVNPNLEVGQLALVKEEQRPPMKWSLGRITKTFPGDEGVVRVVEVKTSSGTFKRPITKISPLPIQNNFGHLSKGGENGRSRIEKVNSDTCVDRLTAEAAA